MKAFSLTNTKSFMSKLLASEIFDDYQVCEVTIKTFNTFNIDCRIVPEYYDDYEFGYEYSLWKDIRPIAFDLIKGRTLPVYCHFILQPKPEETERILKLGGLSVKNDSLKTLTLNIKYINNEVTLITATSYNTFCTDRSADQIWDEYMSRFISTNLE